MDVLGGSSHLSMFDVAESSLVLYVRVTKTRVREIVGIPTYGLDVRNIGIEGEAGSRCPEQW